MENVAVRGRLRAPCTQMLYDCRNRGASRGLRSVARNPAQSGRHVRLESSGTIGQRSACPRTVRLSEIRYSADPGQIENHGWGMKNNSARVAAALLCLVGARTAAAAELGFYLGGQVGQSSRDLSREFYESFNVFIQQTSSFTATEDRTSFDDSGIAFAIVGGYRLTRYIAFEAGYTKYGKVSFSSHATGDFPLEGGTVHNNIDSELSGFSIAAVGTLPLSRDWELFARGGALFATNKIRIVSDATGQQFIPVPGDFEISGSKDTNETFAAIGISRRVFEIYDLRLEYQRVFDAGAADLEGEGDLDAALLGLNVTF